MTLHLKGERFGKLTAKKRDNSKSGGCVFWLCDCDCGGVTSVASAKLTRGHTKSCGCLHGRGKGTIKSDESWTDNLVGRRFGRLVVLSRAKNSKDNAPKYDCQCDCGNLTKPFKQSLMRGTTLSCGCHVLDIRRGNKGEKNPWFKHGLTRNSGVWESFHHMKGRCYRPKDKSFRTYGAIGIAICRIWRNDIERFYKWAMDNGYQEGLEIDRINPRGPYAPWNCQFISGNDNKQKMHDQKGRYFLQ